MNQDIKLRLLIITAIIISFVIIGMSAVIYDAKVHNTELQAIIVEQETKIQALEAEQERKNGKGGKMNGYES